MRLAADRQGWPPGSCRRPVPLQACHPTTPTDSSAKARKATNSFDNTGLRDLPPPTASLSCLCERIPWSGAVLSHQIGGSVKLASDEELLAKHIAGQPDHFEVLVERYSSELYQFLARFTGSRAMAEDVVQEAFLQVHLAASSFDPTRRFKPWLFTIAANKARDMLRSKARHPEMPLDASIRGSDDSQSFMAFLADEENRPERPLEESEQRELVRRVVDQMPANLREVLILAYFQKFPYKEMADILGIPLGTVKSRLHTAVAHFARAYRSRIEKKE